MTWLTWRVQRLQVMAAVAVAVAWIVWMAVLAPDLHQATAALHACSLGSGPLGCAALTGAWSRLNTQNQILVGALYVLPGLLGIVLGAPMVATEIERGTNRLAWTQGITRTRWLAVKVGITAAMVAAIVGAVTLTERWTGSAQLGSTIAPKGFDVTGVVPVGYALFALALGVALGALIRRTGWAVALGVPLFALARVLVRGSVRSHLAPVVTVPVDPSSPFAQPLYSFHGGWFLQSGYVPTGGTAPGPGQTWLSGGDVVARCVRSGSLPLTKDLDYDTAARQCAAIHRLHYVVQYQPPGHFWALQAAEAAVFVGAALALFGITVMAVRRWRT